MISRNWRTPSVVLVCATLILLTGFGVRQTYGLMLAPISSVHGWSIEVFSFAMALQTLIWGLSQPLCGAIADRYGAGRVVIAGAALYAVGLWLMSTAATPLGMTLSTGLLTGIGVSGTGFPILLAVVGRSAPPEHRSRYLGIASAGGSSGQFLIVPAAEYVMSATDYVTTLLVMAALVAMIVPLSAAIAGRQRAPGTAPAGDISLPAAMREASRHSGYILLVTGFFVCGFQTMFIGAHLPNYLKVEGASPGLAATALALIGLFNMIGCFIWGALGGRFSKKYLLATLYMARSVFIVGFISLPISDYGVMAFAALMGLTWLGTVPLTSGLVAQIFGTQYMAMLYGFAFFSHQIGSFLGIWLGGVLFDATGSYNVVWWMAIALGFAAAVIHWPIDERQVPRLAVQPAPQ